MGARTGKKHIVDEQEVMRFNLRRENANGKTYTREELKELLHKMGYTISGNLIKCMTNGENPPFIRVERGKYTFNPKPIYIQRLQTVWDEYGKIRRDRKAKALDIQQSELSAQEIHDAIKLLKSLGYKVLKPVTEYKEIL